MIGWKRSSRFSVRPVLPPARRVHRLHPKLESLEAREAPVSATVPVALLGAAALVPTASARPD
jgi:hypothetical protein